MNRTIYAALLIIIFSAAVSANINTPKTFKITNKSGATITAVFISKLNTNSWGQSVLKDRSVDNNQSFVYTSSEGPGNCSYDVKFVGENGKEYTLHNVNLCNATGVDLTIPHYKAEKQSMEKTTERAHKAK